MFFVLFVFHFLLLSCSVVFSTIPDQVRDPSTMCDSGLFSWYSSKPEISSEDKIDTAIASKDWQSIESIVQSKKFTMNASIFDKIFKATKKPKIRMICWEKVLEEYGNFDYFEIARKRCTAHDSIEIIKIAISAEKPALAQSVIGHLLRHHEKSLTDDQRQEFLETVISKAEVDTIKLSIFLFADYLNSRESCLLNHSLLEVAGAHRNLDVVAFIMKLFNVDVEEYLGTALHGAILKDNLPLIEEILKTDCAEIEKRYSLVPAPLRYYNPGKLNVESAVCLSLENGKMELGNKLLAYHLSNGYRVTDRMAEAAASKNEIEMVKRLLKEMEKPEYQSDSVYQALESARSMALRGAVDAENMELAEYLLSFKSIDTTVALNRAAENGKIDFVKLLLSPKHFKSIDTIVHRSIYGVQGSNVTVNFIEAAFIGAAVSGHIDVINLFLEKNLISKKVKAEALSRSIKYGNLAVAEILDPNFEYEGIKKNKRKIEIAKDLSLQQKKILLSAFELLAKQRSDKKQYCRPENNMVKHEVFTLPSEIIKKYGLSFWHKKMELDLKTQQQDSTSSDITGRLAINLLQKKETEYWCLGESAKNDAFYGGAYVLSLCDSGILPKIKTAEAECEADGFEPFYHARQWEWHFVNDMANMVGALKNNQSTIPGDISLRYRDPEKIDIEELKEYRQSLLKDGASRHLGTGTDKAGKDSEITCVNRTIVSNSGNYGECSGTYFLDNYSVADNRDRATGEYVLGEETGWKMVASIFSQGGLADYYQKNEKLLRALYEQHQELNKFGEVLVISVRKKDVDNLLYAAISGGIKAETNLSVSALIENSKKESTASAEFVDANRQFYCLAVSDIPGERDAVYRIKSLHMSDDEKYKEYLEKRDNLFSKMKS